MPPKRYPEKNTEKNKGDDSESPDFSGISRGRAHFATPSPLSIEAVLP